MVERDVLDRAARRIEQRPGIPFDHILINATHTHHAPTTVTIHGYAREEAFTRQVEDKIVEAAGKAAGRLGPATLLFRLGEESSVGRNSRLLLADGTIYWVGSRDDAVRPTGPFDPELPVLAFRRPDGGFEAVLFNHSTHTIGTHKPGVRSPSFYGLAAQALEKEKGGRSSSSRVPRGRRITSTCRPPRRPTASSKPLPPALDAAGDRARSIASGPPEGNHGEGPPFRRGRG